jgi:hypothetical protein
MNDVAVQVAGVPENNRGRCMCDADLIPDGKYPALNSHVKGIYFVDWKNKVIERVPCKFQDANEAASAPIRYSSDGHLLRCAIRRREVMLSRALANKHWSERRSEC